MKSRFSFTKIKKGRGGARKHPSPNTDAIRLTSNNLIIGKNLMRRYKNDSSAHKTLITIEKDVENTAIRIVLATVSTPQEEVFRPCASSTRRTDFHTDRPKGLYDFPNGNYVEDLKEDNVFVLEVQ